MTGLKIPHLKELSLDKPISTQAQLIALGAAINIYKINWKDFPHLVEVKVFLGYTDQLFWLHYQVNQDLLKIVYFEDQDPVWQDSCVEFFIKQGDNYHNFEFNALGVCLSASGPDRYDRKSLNNEGLTRILRFPSLTRETLSDGSIPSGWALTVAIPHDLIGLKAGAEFWANFYKCGDQTAIPHFISWSAISTATPDFHQPSYFGLLQLER